MTSLIGRLMTAEDARTFALAGNATLTLVSVRTGMRFTYKIRQCQDKADLWFVNLLRGPDNEADFSYLGTIRPNGFAHGKRSNVSAVAPSAQGFRWFWAQIGAQQLPDTLEVWHEGRCGRCGRKLTVPESVAKGFGPECSQIMGLPPTARGTAELPFEGGL